MNVLYVSRSCGIACFHYVVCRPSAATRVATTCLAYVTVPDTIHLSSAPYHYLCNNAAKMHLHNALIPTMMISVCRYQKCFSLVAMPSHFFWSYTHMTRIVWGTYWSRMPEYFSATIAVTPPVPHMRSMHHVTDTEYTNIIVANFNISGRTGFEDDNDIYLRHVSRWQTSIRYKQTTHVCPNT